jgi:hypothetical protein
MKVRSRSSQALSARELAKLALDRKGTRVISRASDQDLDLHLEADLLVPSATRERFVFELVFTDEASSRSVFDIGRNKLSLTVRRKLRDIAGVSRVAVFSGHAVVGDNA